MSDRTPPPRAAPPTAYDSFQTCLPGIDLVARTIAEVRRSSVGWVESDLLRREYILGDDMAMGYVHAYADLLVETGHHPTTAEEEANLVGDLIHTFANYELHRRKTFWVDPPLAWMLSQTRLDIDGELVRLPFPCCAFVFTDAETRALADGLRGADSSVRDRAPTKVVSAYLIQDPLSEGPRELQAMFLFDRLDSGWPYILGRDLWIAPRARIDEILDSHYPDVDLATLDHVFRSDPMKRLLQVVINAVLYATSAGVEPILVRSPIAREPAPTHGKRARAQRREAERQGRRGTREDVFFLPGKIDIRQVQLLQRVQEREDGRAILARFMVRGHWRRAAATWEDQRPRWIEPYWKGPELAAVIEREYRLKT